MTLPFAYPPSSPDTAPSVWLLAVTGDDALRYASRFCSRRHFFVDPLDGSRVISPEDYILLREGRSDTYHVLGPGNPEPEQRTTKALEPFSAVARSQEQPHVPGSTRKVLAIFMAGARLVNQEPQPDGTGLERALATIRHQAIDALPEVRALRSSHAAAKLHETADELLLGLLERETADALRKLRVPGADGGMDREVADSHRRASGSFRGAGLDRLASHTMSLLDLWESRASGQFHLPFANPQTFNDSANAQRIRYGTKRFLAYRIPFCQELRSDRAQPSPTVREFCRSVALPVGRLCQWLDQVQSDRLRSWHELIAPPANDVDRGIRLRAGLDSDFAVLLGLGGRTGPKAGMYRARSSGIGCSVKPTSASARIGQAVEFLVNPGLGRNPVVNIEVQGPVGESILLRVPLRN